MAVHKPGLADLKLLRRQQAEAETPKPPAPKTATRKRGSRSRPPASVSSLAVGSSVRQPSPEIVDVAATPLSNEDRALFRRAVKMVQPIKDTKRASLPPVPRAPADLLRQRRELAMGQEAPALSAVSDQYAPAKLDDGSFIQAGYGPDLIKGLKRGKWSIEASLDLHGSTLDEARERLEQFLQSCLTHQIKCVRIVHGKGYGSKDGASVLKETVRRWLSQMQAVKAYTECGEQDGGSGAVQALLRLK